MATTIFQTTGGEDAALVDSFGWYLNLGRNATQAEIKQATVDFWRGVVKARQQQVAAAGAAITPIAPT
jgi:hypothetical protein